MDQNLIQYSEEHMGVAYNKLNAAFDALTQVRTDLLESHGLLLDDWEGQSATAFEAASQSLAAHLNKLNGGLLVLLDDLSQSYEKMNAVDTALAN
ncbi:MAG: WXG100 family type VII secretion target [Coriobacteriia bacterium]|nr:WXG100 family type VII secretion target [Coriobacteriia bacterium]